MYTSPVIPILSENNLMNRVVNTINEVFDFFSYYKWINIECGQTINLLILISKGDNIYGITIQ